MGGTVGRPATEKGKVFLDIVDKDPQKVPMALTPGERPWPVKALTVLLFVQSVGLLVLAVYNSLLILEADELPASVTPLTLFLGAASTSITFSALSLLALVAAVSFLGLWRTAWSNGLMAQALMLLAALAMYFRGERFYVFFMMIAGIFMVVYLHHPDVQATFQAKAAPEAQEEIL